jgi:erythronate-4-phosphate dehydrogenase
MKTVIDNGIPFIKGTLEKYSEVVYLEGEAITKKDLLNADALIVRTRTKCDARLLEGTKVRFIASATIGYDHIDTAYCKAKGIHWTNAPGCNSSSVQQYIIAAILHIAEKHLVNLTDKTIGIVGVGNVGKKIARICSAIGMRVLMNDPPRERAEGSRNFVSLDTILEKSFIITLHVPLTNEGRDKTYHRVNEDFLAGMKKHQILINSSRGEVVETELLKTALKEKWFTGCVLDVWEDEPDIDLELLNLIDIATPHIAGYSADGKANGTAKVVNAFGQYTGFDTNSWYPHSIPVPEKTTIEIDCRNMTHQQILELAVRSTYDIIADDVRLRNSPETFERQRGHYPLRREFPVYALRLRNADDEIKETLEYIGFNIHH